MLQSLAVIWLVLVGSCLGRNIPDYIHICKRTDPEVAKCVIESIEALRPRLKSGIAEIGVPSIEPVKTDEVQIFRGGDGSNFKAYLKNVEVRGASDFKILRLKPDIENNVYEIVVNFPKLTMEGDYFVDAKLLSLPIKGEGRFSAEATAIEGNAVLEGKIIKHNKHREIFFTNLNLNLKIQDFDVRLENLFGGDATLRQALREVFTDNKKEIMQSALPLIEQKVAKFLLDNGNKITNGLDYDEVLPE